MTFRGLSLFLVLLQPRLSAAVAPSRNTRSLVKLIGDRHSEGADTIVRPHRRVETVAAKLRDGSSHESAAVQNSTRPRTKKPAWFRGFAEEESTYDPDADFGRVGDPFSPEIQFQDGWSPDVRSPAGRAGAVDSGFFHESMSGGPKEAWQTHSPAMNQGIAGHGASIGRWYQRRTGNWAQEYIPGDHSHSGYEGSWVEQSQESLQLPASWFDANVAQVDGFGRKKYPGQLSGRRLVGWQERAVNTTLTCAAPGCVANTTLYGFNWMDEQAQKCKLSVFFHPTDFGNEGEVVSWITVNGVTVRSGCVPTGKSGCDANESKLLYPCVTEVSLDKLMAPMGELNISAKISDLVDQCPHNGNLLSAVPMVTCMVAPKNPSPVLGGMPNVPALNEKGATWVTTPEAENVSFPLKCRDPGCMVAQPINFYRQPGVTFSSCLMTIVVNHTDFDSSDSNETIELLGTTQQNITTFAQPTRNPCEAARKGSPLPIDQQRDFVLVDNVDVTNEVNTDALTVFAKISPGVDDCAMGGNLLDGRVEVNCVAGPAPSATRPASQAV